MMLILMQLFSARGFQEKSCSQVEQGQGCRYATHPLPNPAAAQTQRRKKDKEWEKKREKKSKLNERADLRR